MTDRWGERRPTGPRLSDTQRLAWLRLIRSENVGPATFRQLLNHFGSAEAAIDGLPGLSQRGGARRVPRIASSAEAEKELAAAHRAGARFVALGEPDFPPMLRLIDAPPPLLAVRGDGDVLARPSIAIVGARDASAAGRTMATRLARGLADAGLVVTSGLARGIDAAAHQAAVKTGTIAVLAGGVDHLYPPEHGPLLDAILAEGGAVVSEMPMGWEPRAQDFPRRNRLISGTTLATVVVEAARRSGSLHTARFAAEQGREVFAVPGSPLDPRTEGCNYLIREGATLTTSADDVLTGIAPLLDRPPPEPGAEEPSPGDDGGYAAEPDDRARDAVLTALGPTPVPVDDVIRYTGLPVATVLVILLELDLAGRLERHSGGLISRTF